MLKIFHMLNDNEVVERHKLGLLCKWFYAAEIPDEPYSVFTEFSLGKSVGKGEEPVKMIKQFDFDFDAKEIYASFLKDYGLSLVKEPFIHWYEFRILMQNLSPESPINRKIQARFLELDGLKGKALYQAQQIKESVALPISYSKKELQENSDFEDEWGNVGLI